MDAQTLATTACESALTLLEKQGSFLPFCKAISESGETFIYTPSTDGNVTEERCFESVLTTAKADRDTRHLRGIAICSHSRVRFADSAEKAPAIEVEVHYQGSKPIRWFFLYRMESADRAVVFEYHRHEVTREDLFA